MPLLLHLESILSDFRFMFNSQNFALFEAFLYGFMTDTGGGALTQLYQSSASQTRYGSMPKFLSRGKWDTDAVAVHLIYQRHRVNESKFHDGHEFGALGLLCATPTQWLLFPVWVKLIVPQTVRDKGDAILKRICSQLPRGLILFDRGFARRKVFERCLGLGHHLLCRAKSNAVFYRIPKLVKVRRPGHPKKYGDRLNIPRLRYKEVCVLDRTYQVASEDVLTKMCPTPVRLVVIRTRPKPAKPYRYFLVFTTDLTLEIPKIVEYYQHRWHIETAFRDLKPVFGFRQSTQKC